MGLIIPVGRRALPEAVIRARLWRIYLNKKWIALRGIAGMLRRTIASRTGAYPANQVNFSKKLKVIPRPDWTGLHKILPRITSKAGTHEHIEDVMHDPLGIQWRNIIITANSAGQIGVTTVVIVLPS